MKYGLQLYSVRDVTETDLYGALKQVAALGYENVEFAGFFGHDGETVAAWLKELGLRIDAVGMQGHMGMDYPDMAEFEESLLAFAGTGCNVMITEWDMSALPTVKSGAEVSDTVTFRASMNPYPDGLPAEVSAVWNERMKSFMDLFIRHSDVVTRVTAWGVSDDDSWKNDWPMKGRIEYPLLFDRNLQPKPFLNEYSK